ncbi:hypothetical protein HMPREF1544_08585 [Mucor circinelloides 1006PhL]|uniref:Uncharacterized protein n=1 Tax=Mucor circinelloides f. circinelloides (strain 1006PhL) TaxID=1220926 RepID=S2J8B1_MUCC1|nr:hypothetical protein HMPREF1544_08585 [Mucor circinelloides 1006PhL]
MKQVVGHFSPLPDENCGLRALALAITSNQEQYKLLKAKVIAILNRKNYLCNEASLDSRDNWFQFPEMGNHRAVVAQLFTNIHNEGWYRLHIYSNVFDEAFLHDKKFESKRSECYSNITKAFAFEQNQRVDFILRNLNDEKDLLTVEEKPTRKGVKSDMAKGKILQRLMLKDGCRRIGSEEIMTRFEAITCQRLVDDKYLVYKKGTFQFPKSPNHSGEFAQLILGVISLRRLVLRSYSNLNLIVQAKYREEIEMLNIDHEDGDVLFRSDSTAATDAADDDMVNVYNNNEMEPWLEEELLLKIDNIKQGNEDVKKYGDWEVFLMEKVKKRRVSSSE